MALAAGCGPRVVEVRTAPGLAPTQLEVVNRLTQAVNLSVVTEDGVEYFVRQVAAGASVVAPVRELPVGTRVTIIARPVDGARPHRFADRVLGGPITVVIP